MIHANQEEDGDKSRDRERERERERDRELANFTIKYQQMMRSGDPLLLSWLAM